MLGHGAQNCHLPSLYALRQYGLHCKLSVFVQDNETISKEQCQKQHSILHQVQRVVNYTKNNKRNRLSAGQILPYIEKPLDSAWRDGLIYKRNIYGIPKYLIKIIKAFMTDRKFLAPFRLTTRPCFISIAVLNMYIGLQESKEL